MSAVRPEAVFLDLDDTILAFESLKEECWNEVAGEFSAYLRGISPGDFVSSLLHNSKVFWSQKERARKWRIDLEGARVEIVGTTTKGLGIFDHEACREIAGAYSVLRTERIEPLPGALDTLAVLRDKGLKTALITNGSSESQRGKIRRFGITGYFDMILIEGEQGFGKPDERIYRMALEGMGVEPENTWMAGDNIVWDVFAPQGLGIRGVWVDYRGQGLRPGSKRKPFLILRSLPEILHYL